MSGGSLIITIPKSLVADLKIIPGDFGIFKQVNGEIILRKVSVADKKEEIAHE